MAVFAVVVEAKSFTGASKRLGIAKSAVSRYVSELEEMVGVLLLRRTTRTLAMTESGERFFIECARLVGAAVDGMDAVEPNATLTGTMRVAATLGHGQYVVVPAIESFLKLHPEITIDLDLHDRFIDLVEHGIDLSLRVGSRGATPHYISTKIGEMQYRIFAARRFLNSHKPIKTPADAARLPWVLGQQGPSPTSWAFQKGKRRTEITVKPSITVSNIVARMDAAALGLGLVGLPDFMVDRKLPKNLVETLVEYRVEPTIPIYGIYPSARFIPPRVSEFLAHLKSWHAA